MVKNQDIEDVHYYGIEVADGFVGDMKSREIKLNSDYSWNKIKFLHEDVRDSMISNASLITSVFTLQFMSMRDRLPMIKKVYNGLNEGGAFIFAEKTICENAKFQEMITFNDENDIGQFIYRPQIIHSTSQWRLKIRSR